MSLQRDESVNSGHGTDIIAAVKEKNGKHFT